MIIHARNKPKVLAAGRDEVPLRANPDFLERLEAIRDERGADHRHPAHARLREAHKLGFTRAIVPAATARQVRAPAGIEVQGVSTVLELWTALFGGRRRAAAAASRQHEDSDDPF